MPSAASFQNRLYRRLVSLYGDDLVEKEWTISKNASDSLRAQVGRYAPRLDIAVGPFNIEAGNRRRYIERVFSEKTPQYIQRVFGGLSRNPNPRCSLAIEIVFSGSSKHNLGDLTNAGLMGTWGLVIAHPSAYEKVQRVFQYVNAVKDLNKISSDFLSNVNVIKTGDAARLFRM